MATTERYTTVIELNSEQAKRNLDELRKQVESWKSDLAEARENKMGKSFIAAIRKELREAEKELKKYDNEVARTIETMNDLNSASVKRIEEAQKSLKRLASEVPHDSPFYQQLNEQLDMVTQELENIKATKAFEQMQREAEGATRTFAQTRAEAEFVRQTVENIDTASLKQLRMAEQAAKGIKENAQQGTAEYNGASTSLEKIRAKLSDIDAQERKVVTTAEQYNQAMKNIRKEEKMVSDEMELIDRTLRNLDKASIRDIEFSVKALKEQLQDAERSGKSVEELTEKLQRLNKELKKVQDMQKPGDKGGLFSRGIRFLNTNWGAITQIMGAVTGLSTTVRSAVKDYAEMEEEMADVRKYTGLADEAVRDLNEDLKKMDTRTPREQLNKLAGSAGRLGLQSKKDILEFVEAADMIGVALGDDLGDGAVDKIGKLAMAFGEDEEKGLKKAMLSTGSALNELAQNSSAQAGYLVEFTARVAGFGKQLGLTQAQIMGFGTVMDENLLKDEMAATAFGNMLTKMQTDTEKFARIAGMSVKDFTELLNKDANAAILALADNLKKADPQNMMKMLDDMGLDGSRAVGVLSTLADKIDDVRRHQQRATEAYEKATSVQNEFNTMNNTVEARLEKCKKAFKEMTVELGEKLLPVVKYTISSAGMLAKALGVIMEWLDKYKGTIITTCTVMATLVAWKNKDVIVTKLMTFWNEKVLVSLKAMGRFIKSNPWGIAITAVATLTALMHDLAKNTDAAARKRRMLKEVEDEAHRSTGEEVSRIQILKKTIEDANVSIDNRRKAIEELENIIPGYHASLSEEGRLISHNGQLIDKYVEQLKNQARMQAALAKLPEAELNEKNVYEEAPENIKNMYESMLFARGSGTEWNENDAIARYGVSPTAWRVFKSKMAKAQAEVAEYNALIDDFTEKNHLLADEMKALQEEGSHLEPEIVPPYKPEKEIDKEEQERKKRLKEAEEAAKAETDAVIAAKTHEYAMGRIAYREYVEDIARLQKEGLEKRRDVYEKGSAEYEKLNRQVEVLSYKGDQKVNQMKLEEMQHCMLQQQMEIEMQAAREEITEEEKQERLRLLNETYLADKVELYKEGSKERIDAEWELEQAEERNRQERERRYQQQLQQVREQYLNMSNERHQEIALKGLEELHSKQLLSEREYQEAKLALQAQYANYETSSEHDQRVSSNALKVASDKAKQKIDGKNPKTLSMPIVGDITLYQSTMEQLKEMYQSDELTHAQYLAAKQQATAQFCESLAAQMQAAYNTVNQVMSAASSYFSAQQEYETAQVQRKYEKEIEAAGSNQKKVKKLQEQQQKEEAAVKTKYAKRAATIQMAQAVATTAMNAIQAYGAVLQPANPASYVYASIAAAAAIAAGMLQIATIKKQQQAQEAGYYEGGFTHGRRYRKEAGVVHEGEFVANHQAVNNPNVLPFLNFLDQAQRNNTVGSLTAADVSRSMGAGAGASPSGVIAPIVNVQTDNEELRQAVEAHREAMELLLQRLEQPINAQVVLTGPDGLNAQQQRLDAMMKNK